MKMKEYNYKYISGISVVAALGGLLFGYDWVVIGGAKPFYENYFDIASNPQLQGWAMSCALVGCVFGTMMVGFLSRKYSRKKLLIVSATMFFLSAIGTGMVQSFTLFVLYRIVGGIGIGLASNLSPVYIAEVAPASIRGRLVSINQLTIVVGILLAQIVNWFIAEPVTDDVPSAELLNSWNYQQGWRYMFWAEAIPSFFFFLLMWFVPDSPRWLISNGRLEDAKSILQKIGGENYAKSTIENINASFHLEAQNINTSGTGTLSKKYFPVLVIGIVLAVFQQWCGINVIFLYAEEIFSSAGYTVSGMLFNVVISGGVNLVFTLIAMALVDKVGRRVLLLIGSLGLAIIYTIIGFFYFQNIQGLPLLALIMGAIACYALTLAPVTWVVLSEIFPNKIRGIAIASATFALWIANTLLAFFFPIINENVNIYGSFWGFALICLLGFFFVMSKVKETKGKTLEEIELELEANSETPPIKV